jgi:hypothetical protein
VATATAAAATSAAAGLRGEGFGAGACGGRAEYGKLDGGFFAGALGTGNFLLLVDYDFFEFVLAVVADVFVDGHVFAPLGDNSNCCLYYSKRITCLRTDAFLRLECWRSTKGVRGHGLPDGLGRTPRTSRRVLESALRAWRDCMDSRRCFGRGAGRRRGPRP